MRVNPIDGDTLQLWAIQRTRCEFEGCSNVNICHIVLCCSHPIGREEGLGLRFVGCDVEEPPHNHLHCALGGIASCVMIDSYTSPSILLI